jgi:hypothetical protein
LERHLSDEESVVVRPLILHTVHWRRPSVSRGRNCTAGGTTSFTAKNCPGEHIAKGQTLHEAPQCQPGTFFA